jgi:hypothetical protein
MRLAACLLLTCLLAPAWAASNPAETVPFDHWAYDAIQTLADAGLIIGGPEGRDVTRDEWALALLRLARSLDELGPPDLGRYVSRERVRAALATLVRVCWPDVEEAVTRQGQGGRETLHAWLAGIKKGNWLYETAQAILRDVGEAPVAQPFPDVPRDHWAFGAVERLRKAGIVIGYPDGRFGTKARTPTDTVPFD